MVNNSLSDFIFCVETKGRIGLICGTLFLFIENTIQGGERMLEINPLALVQIKAILTAVLGSAILAFTFYLKRPEGEPWDNEKFFKTMAIAVIVGFVAGWLNISPQSAQDWLTQTGYMTLIVFAVDNLWKWIKKRYFPEAISDVK